jgi:hypothetical protein
MKRILFAGLILCFAGTLPAGSRQASSGDELSPLYVTATPTAVQNHVAGTTTLRDFPAADISVQNVSGRCITKYTLRFEFSVGRQGQLPSWDPIVHEVRDTNGVPSCLNSGQVDELSPQMVPVDREGRPLPYTIVVERAFFVDGTHWDAPGALPE